jgi:hypothetical protein
MTEGVASTMIYCKNFRKCHNVSPSTTIKKKERKEVRKERKKETKKEKNRIF